MQPADGGVFACVAEDLEFGIPGLAQQLAQRILQADAALSGGRHGRTQPVFRDLDVTVRAGHRMKDTQLGSVGVTLTLVGGGSLNEKLEEISPSERIYRYSIISGPLPVANYEAVIHVRDNGDGTSTVEWSSEFDASGASENDAVAAIQGVYQAGLDNIRKMFGV